MSSYSNLRVPALLTAAALAAALLTAGCHDDTPPTTTVVTPPPATTTTIMPSGSTTAPVGTAAVPDTKINTNAGPGGSTGTDAALADQVNTAIVHNKQMTGARMEVVATAGIVTLNGQVQNQQQKALAQSSAQQVPGVSSIKNKLIIVTTGGAKPKPMVVTKTVVIHDQAPAAPTDAGSAAPDPSAPTVNQVPPPASTPGSAQTAPVTGGTTGQ